MQIKKLKLKTGFKLLVVVFTFSFLFFNLIAAPTFSAEDQFGGKGKLDPFNLELDNPLRTTNLIDLIERIIDVLTFYIATPVAVLMIIVGAFQMLSAGGDPEKFATGKKTILYAAIGFAVLLAADLLIGLTQEILGVK